MKVVDTRFEGNHVPTEFLLSKVHPVADNPSRGEGIIVCLFFPIPSQFAEQLSEQVCECLVQNDSRFHILQKINELLVNIFIHIIYSIILIYTKPMVFAVVI